MTSRQEYELRRQQLEAMHAALMEGIPTGMLGFSGVMYYRELLNRRKELMLRRLPASQLIEFGMYNSYRRCRMN